MPESIFINYRRQTESGVAGRIYDSLSRDLPGISIFMDVDKLKPGDDFEQGLEKSLASCKVLLAVVGPEWLTMKNSAGKRRLDDPADFVRRELRTALSKGVRIIPVLVNGARMPDASELPDDIKGFGKRQAMEIRHERYNADVRDLAHAIATIAPGARATTRKYAKLGVAALALAAVLGGTYYAVWTQWLSWNDQAHYQLEFDRQLLRKYYPVEIEARVNGNTVQYRAVSRQVRAFPQLRDIRVLLAPFDSGRGVRSLRCPAHQAGLPAHLPPGDHVQGPPVPSGHLGQALRRRR